MPKLTEVKNFIRRRLDISGDGKLNIVDITASALVFIFSTTYLFTVFVFLKHLRLITLGDEPLDSLSAYISPLTSVCGTLVTLVYGLSFFGRDTSGSTTVEAPFFDFDRDGRVGTVDRLCTFVGSLHAFILLVDSLLWFRGIIPTECVVDMINSTTRLILLFMTSSYHSHSIDTQHRSGWRFLFDINHDGYFQLVDLLALVCNSLYFSAVLWSWMDLIFFHSMGNSHMDALINLTGQMNFLLVGGFAAVYLSDSRMNLGTERALRVFSLFYLVLLMRTVLEMYMQDVAFAGIAKLANGMVLGVTQLVMGSYTVFHKIKAPLDTGVIDSNSKDKHL